MRRVRLVATFALLLAYFLTGFVLVNLLMIPLWLAGPGGAARVRRFSGMMLRHFMRCMARTGNMTIRLPAIRDLRGAVLVGNHPSLFDAPAIIAANDHTLCFFKSTLRRSMLGLPGAQLADYLPNDSGVAGLLLAARRIREGANVLIFPEATRTVGVTMNPFGRSAAVLAMKTGAPVVCLAFRYSAPFLAKGGNLFVPPVMPMRLDIEIVGRLDADAHADADTLTTAMRTMIESALLRPDTRRA